MPINAEVFILKLTGRPISPDLNIMNIVCKVFFDVVENIHSLRYYCCLAMIVFIWQKDHWYILLLEPDYDSVQCDTVCFPMGTRNFILINTGEVFREVHLHHCCVGICCCRSQSACIICFCMQLVIKVMQLKLCDLILKSWQQIFKGAFLFVFLCPTVLAFFSVIPCGCYPEIFLVNFIQIGCLEFRFAKYTVSSHAFFVSGVANTWLDKFLSINRKVLRQLSHFCSFLLPYLSVMVTASCFPGIYK